MSPYDGIGAPWWAAITLFGGAMAMKALDFLLRRRKERTETDANIGLIEALRTGLARMDERIKSMEEAQDRLNKRLDEEIALRMAAQEEAHRLKMRVQTLESTMRQIGAVIPPDHA